MNLTSKIKTELNELGIKPRKSLGQNFLINDGIYQKILEAADVGKKDTILEIGPGLGTLTEYLSRTGASVIAVEKDRFLANYLAKKFESAKNVRIIEGDILKSKIENLELKDNDYKVVGNIPYYITSHLLRIIFEKWPQSRSVVLMVQKEVAQRIVAKPPRMSMLAVSVQYFVEPKIISYVSKGNFFPPPDVDSAIIKLIPHPISDPVSFQQIFFEVVRTGFSGKRKQLINNLSKKLKNKTEIQDKLTSVGIDPQRRAETLTIGEWRKITNILYLPG